MRTYAPVGLRELSCQGCGKEFAASRSDAKWCEDCRWAKTHAHNSRPRSERLAPSKRERSCRQCGKEFTAKRNQKSPFCWECREPSKYDRCPDCGKTKRIAATRCIHCHARQLPHPSSQRGEANPNWKGGRTRHQGYIRVKNPDPNGRPRYIGEHILVWEQAHGPLPPKWNVHHLNGLRDDNRLENLVAMSRSDHHGNHHGPWEARIRDLETQLNVRANPSIGGPDPQKEKEQK